MKNKFIYLNFGANGIGINFDTIYFHKSSKRIHFSLCGHLVFSLYEDEFKHKLRVKQQDGIYYYLNMR
ncbi:hypothetical protein [Sedimentibacter sp.]|uniref:hypothetical protein n=1 Tax=Sedimentibacter sp. TaxID=1960295 RepID=UPI002898613E|nr:hypothetical protein [Sedimentibacter sp.]